MIKSRNVVDILNNAPNMIESRNVVDILNNAPEGTFIPEFLREKPKITKIRPAFIDISIVCMRCGEVLYTGCYTKGIIGRLKKAIRKSGWVHHPSEGTLCPDCYKSINTIFK